MEARADRYYSAVAWLNLQAQLKMWHLHQGTIQMAFRVQVGVDHHLSMWRSSLGLHMREQWDYALKFAHDRLMEATERG